jgi:hypothetical protein
VTHREISESDCTFLHGGHATLRERLPPAKDEVSVLYFFRRAGVALTCETRLNPQGTGFQLVITENAHERIENFDELRNLLAREHELLKAWRAQGWHDAGQPTRTPVDTWPGPR